MKCDRCLRDMPEGKTVLHGPSGIRLCGDVWECLAVIKKETAEALAAAAAEREVVERLQGAVAVTGPETLEQKRMAVAAALGDAARCADAPQRPAVELFCPACGGKLVATSKGKGYWCEACGVAMALGYVATAPAAQVVVGMLYLVAKAAPVYGSVHFSLTGAQADAGRWPLNTARRIATAYQALTGRTAVVEDAP